MKKFIIIFFGLKGSWKWACKQLDKGKIIRPESATGTIKFKLDDENQRRIVYTLDRDIKTAKWANANIFLSDFESTDWVIFN
jgi:hypothetical protein